MRLYSYFRSSAAYRVRIGLALKGIDYEYVPVQIVKGRQFDPEFDAINPQHLVPVLEDGSRRLYQSLAILQYLDETHPEPKLLPADPAERNRVRSLALISACEIHPLNNLRVLKYLVEVLKVNEEQKLDWYRHWVSTGFNALERRLATEPQTGTFCHGEKPGFADVVLVPQVANARRFQVDLSPFPTIVRIDAACNALEPFRKAAPAVQPDAE
jgi:maleylacetoacetate isomerase